MTSESKSAPLFVSTPDDSYREDRIAQILASLSLQEKASFLAGQDDWHLRGIPRLKIPAIFVADCGHGVTLCGERSSPSTCFPTGIGMAATWNPALLEQAGRVIGRECKALGVSLLLGPKINLHRLPLNGRSFETFSEDPLLAGRSGAAIMRGIQAEGVGACLKAMAANNQQRDQQAVSSEVGPRALRELYLRAFEIAISEGHPCAIMTSYNKLNGEYAAENRWLIQQVIKDEWQFPGFIVSDWRSIFTDKVYSSGLDLEMPGPGKFFDTANTLRAIDEGQLGAADLDDKVTRILRAVLRFGRDEKAASQFATLLNSAENRSVALQVAEESIVLLQNKAKLLPLDRTGTRRIAVIGPNASAARLGGGGSASVSPFYSVSPLDGIRELAPDAEIIFAEGCSLVGSMIPVSGVFEHLEADGTWAPGLTADFFNPGNAGAKPDASWTVPEIDFSWGWASPGPGVSRFEYRVRFSGRLVPRCDGDYRFGLFGQEGLVQMRMADEHFGDEQVEGEEINFEQQYESRYVRAELALRAGQPVAIAVDYWKRAARAAVRFEWEEPGSPSPIDAAVELARNSDIAIICAGLSNLYEGGGRDRESIDLPPAQDELIRKVAAVNPKTIVVINSGGPVAMPWAGEVGAILESWYPGQEGGRALARILFGEVNPSGKLPDTVPYRLADHAAAANYPGDGQRVFYEEGVFVGYRHFDTAGVDPQFPFGFGLSYTTFAYADVTLSADSIRPQEEVVASVSLTNTGQRAGSEVVQLYIRDCQASVPRPDKELRNFQKVNLSTGETTVVRLAIKWRDLAFWDESTDNWLVEPGEFQVLIGGHSRDVRAVSLHVRAA